MGDWHCPQSASACAQLELGTFASSAAASCHAELPSRPMRVMMTGSPPVQVHNARLAAQLYPAGKMWGLQLCSCSSCPIFCWTPCRLIVVQGKLTWTVFLTRACVPAGAQRQPGSPRHCQPPCQAAGRGSPPAEGAPAAHAGQQAVQHRRQWSH